MAKGRKPAKAEAKETGPARGGSCEVTYRNGTRETLRGSVDEVRAKVEEGGRSYLSIVER